MVELAIPRDRAAFRFALGNFLFTFLRSLDLLQKVRVVAVVVARAEQVEDLLGVGRSSGRGGVRDGHDGNVVLVGVQTWKRGRTRGIAESRLVE